MSRTSCMAGASAPKILSRAGLAVGALMFLSGCAETVALVPLAAYTADGLSYVSSGKGLADHAISAAADRDCALFRLAQGGAVCAVDEALKQAPALAMTERTAAGGDSDERIREIVARAEGWRPEERAAGEGKAAGAVKAPANKNKDASSIPFN